MEGEIKASFLVMINIQFMNMVNSHTKQIYTKVILIIIASILLLLDLYLTIALLNKQEGPENIDIVEVNNVIKEKKQLIVLISMDGLGANLVGENTPYLSSLLDRENVSYTLDMQTIEQSETMPSHVSMVTGLTQENHKFYLNSLIPGTPPIEEKTIFDYALENDYTFYSFLTKDKLLYLLGEKTGENIVSKEEYSSEIMGDIDELVETDSTKVFVFLHFRDIDSYGHTYGWNSNEQHTALKTLDNNLRLLTDDLNQEFEDYERYYIFTADHGGEGTQHSNGCENCRRIPFIVVSENTNDTYESKNSINNIYDTTCVVLDIMKDTVSRSLDCGR